MDGASEKSVFARMVHDAIKVRQLVFANGFFFSSTFSPHIVSFAHVVHVDFFFQQCHCKALLDQYVVNLQMLMDDLEIA